MCGYRSDESQCLLMHEKVKFNFVRCPMTSGFNFLVGIIQLGTRSLKSPDKVIFYLIFTLTVWFNFPLPVLYQYTPSMSKLLCHPRLSNLVLKLNILSLVARPYINVFQLSIDFAGNDFKLNDSF